MSIDKVNGSSETPQPAKPAPVRRPVQDNSSKKDDERQGEREEQRVNEARAEERTSDTNIDIKA